MERVRFIIYVVMPDGTAMEAFRWTRGEAAGIARALREARETGWDVIDAYAVPVA